MANDIHHEETYTHKSGNKYNVRWFYDHDFGSPLDLCDCHGVTERLDWNPTDEEQLEQHLLDNDCELEEETRLRMMRQIQPPSNHYDSGLYYDVLASLHKARTEWGVEPERCMEVVEKDFAYLKGWFNDAWFWLTIGVAPLDEDGEIDEDFRAYCGGYESTILDSDENNVKWRDEVINDQIVQVEWGKVEPYLLELDLHKTWNVVNCVKKNGYVPYWAQPEQYAPESETKKLMAEGKIKP